MSQIKCKSCGKNFDGERYYGICPFCGTYHAPEEKGSQTGKDENPYDGGKESFSSKGFGGNAYQSAPEQNREAGVYARAMESADADPSVQQMYLNQLRARQINNDTKATVKKSKAPKILVAVNIVMIALTVATINIHKLTAKTETISVEPYYEASYQIGEKINLGQGTDLAITGTRIVDLSLYGSFVPDGKKLIQVFYEVNPGENVTYAYYNINSVYIYDPSDGNYHSSVDTYQIKDFMAEHAGIEKNTVVENLMYISRHDKTEGSFLFLAGEDSDKIQLTMDRYYVKGKDDDFLIRSDGIWRLSHRYHVDIDLSNAE